MTSRTIRIITVIALIACSLTLFIPLTASAHANLLNSSPKSLEELDAPPERVIIWFTEPIEAAFSAISVRDSLGAEVTVGTTMFETTEPTAMWVHLTELKDGTYTVVWRNVSSVDGHKVTGSFLFAVGEPLGAVTETTDIEQPILLSPFDPVIRWVIYIGIAVFAGGFMFEILVVTRIARTEDQSYTLVFVQSVSSQFAAFALLAIVLVIFGQIAQLILQTTVAFEVATLDIRPSQLADVLTQSDWGRFWSWRFIAAILVVIALLTARQLVHRAKNKLNSDESGDLPLITETAWGIAAIALGSVYLLLISLTGHNAATPTDIRWLAVMTNIIHIISATIWVGGIAYILVASSHVLKNRNQSSPTALLQLAIRFAPLAIFATIILVASGIVSSLMQVTTPEALNTPYGRVLGAKILLFVILIALAIKNNRSIAKAVEHKTAPTRSLTRYVSIELSVAFAVLFATASLASLEPARQYAGRNSIVNVNYVGHNETIAGAKINVKLEPGQTGTNNLSVIITDNDGNPFRYADEVRARIKYLDDEFGEYFIPLNKVLPSEWRLNDITIGVAGTYQLDVSIVRSDAFDSHISTRFSAASPTFASNLIRPTAQSAMIAVGGLVAIAGLAFLTIRVFNQRPIRFDLSLPQGIAIFVSIVGISIILNALTIGIGLPAKAKGSPFPLTQESVEIGRATYNTTCATCHGKTGRGDGPTSPTLNPQPADLAIHVPLHTDNELYSFISNGIEGTSMVAQLGNLTSDEIWHIVNYIRTISE